MPAKSVYRVWFGGLDSILVCALDEKSALKDAGLLRHAHDRRNGIIPDPPRKVLKVDYLGMLGVVSTLDW